MNQDVPALLWSYLYVGAVVAAGEVARRMAVSREVARKIIHVGVGLWIFGTLALFRNPYMAIIPPLTAAAGNYVIHRKQLLQAVADEPENLGTIWFPLSFAVLLLAAWQRPVAAAGGVMAMTIGDALASLVGVRWGRHRYTIPGGLQKSLEGSLAMLVGTVAALLVTFLLVPEGLPLLSRSALLGLAVLTAVVATCAEALGVKGRDNLWVPLAAGAVLYGGLSLPMHWLASMGLGAALATAIGILAWLKGSLSPSGVLGAILTGTLLFGLGGWAGGLALVSFFVSSSVLSQLFRGRKRSVEEEYAKTGTRDLGQALANGGMAALLAVPFAVTGDVRYLGALVGSLAAANADTWATELGVLSRRPPRLITTLQVMEAGASGAVSGAGTLAAAGGATCVALVAALANPALFRFVPGIALGGLAGAMVDSLLGATVQSQYWCPHCARATERRIHRCGTETRLYRGLPWMGNDAVNLVTTLVGALVGFLVVR